MTKEQALNFKIAQRKEMLERDKKAIENLEKDLVRQKKLDKEQDDMERKNIRMQDELSRMHLMM